MASFSMLDEDSRLDILRKLSSQLHQTGYDLQSSQRIDSKSPDVISSLS